MEQLNFTYKGGSPFIDYLCEANKIYLLEDVNFISREQKTIFEEALEFPAKELVVLFPDRNLSNFGFSHIMKQLGDLSKAKQIDGAMTMLISDKAIFSSPFLILHWENLMEFTKEIPVSYLVND